MPDRVAASAGGGAREDGSRWRVTRAGPAAAAPAGDRPPRPPPPPPPPPYEPSATAIQAIVEMGFTEPQARLALVVVRGRSIEAAMEYLIENPQDLEDPAGTLEAHMARERATRTAFEARFGPIAGSAQAPPADAPPADAPPADEAPGNGDGDGGDGGLREPGGEDGAGEAGVPDALAEDGDDAVGELRRAIAMSMGEDEDAATPEGDGAGGAPDAPPSANANAASASLRFPSPRPRTSSPRCFASPSGTRRWRTRARSF